ncbi:MAG: hypothetical protein AAB640_00225, partial [Patescibacteria group bacterium]
YPSPITGVKSPKYSRPQAGPEKQNTRNPGEHYQNFHDQMVRTSASFATHHLTTPPFKESKK